MNAKQFLTHFPQIKQDVDTGGGCAAWQLHLRHTDTEDVYILVTSHYGDAQAPEMSDDGAMFGLYDGCELVRGCDEAYTWERACAWVRGILAEYSDTDPPSVTDCLSAVLESWCTVNGLPFECADDLRVTRSDLTPAQRDWLNAYCTLWGLTGDAS